MGGQHAVTLARGSDRGAELFVERCRGDRKVVHQRPLQAALLL